MAPSEQGQLQGARSSLMGIAGLVAPTLFTQTFAAFIGSQRDLHLPGAPFLLAALLLRLGLIVAWRVTRSQDAGASSSVPPRTGRALPQSRPVIALRGAARAPRSDARGCVARHGSCSNTQCPFWKGG